MVYVVVLLLLMSVVTNMLLVNYIFAYFHLPLFSFHLGKVANDEVDTSTNNSNNSEVNNNLITATSLENEAELLGASNTLRIEKFDERIRVLREELGMPDESVDVRYKESGVEAMELHPLVHNLPHDSIKVIQTIDEVEIAN